MRAGTGYFGLPWLHVLYLLPGLGNSIFFVHIHSILLCVLKLLFILYFL